MLRNFLAELARMPDTLARQAQAAAPREVSGTLHTLKGLAATLGADGLWQVAANAERALAADPSPAEAARQARSASDAIAAVAAPLARLLAALQAEAASTVPEPPLAPAAWHRALGELAVLLENSDMRATDLMATLQQQDGRGLGPELQALDDAVGALDFERALPLCRDLLARTRP
jgi:HPt (histidine-containing phosphotransfer) domain-containing protein